MPPALSVIGPKASTVMMMPHKLSMPIAAIATPYRPAKLNATSVPATITSTGNAVAFMPTAKPAMMFVP